MKNVSDTARITLLAAATLVACRAAPPTSGRKPKSDPQRCATCHMPEFVETKHVPHAGARPTTCGVCHSESAWKPWRVDHPWWVLTGAHARAAADKAVAGDEKQVKCLWCHQGNPPSFKGTKKACLACHAPDREKSTFPGHSEFADTCQDCHSDEAWKPTTKVVPRPTEVDDAGAPDDAGAEDGGGGDAGASKPRPKPKPKPKPRPEPGLPDIISHPSRHGR